MKHTPFHGWGAFNWRTEVAIDAGHPEWAELHISRAGGVAAESVKYFTGKECKHGHVAPRYSNGSRCTVCAVTQVPA